MNDPRPSIQASPVEQHDIITVDEVAEIIRCKPSSVYNLTRTRGLARYKHPIPHVKLPCGLRFFRSSVLAWIKAQETVSETGVQQ